MPFEKSLRFGGAFSIALFHGKLQIAAVPLPRFAKLSEDRRRAILDAALHEFASQGFASASYNRIIAATGISKGAMYYYFADKTDLYLAVIEDMLDRIEHAARADGPIRGNDPESFWTELAERALNLQQTIAENDATLAAFGDRLYQSGIGVEHMTTRLTGWIRSLLQVGQERGAIRTDLEIDLLAHAATGLMTSLDRYFIQLGASMEPEMGAQAVGLCRDLLWPRE